MVVFVYITCPDQAVAVTLATSAVEQKLAACANIMPQMLSVYSWQSQIRQDSESVLILKTTKEFFPRLERQIRADHPYDCPCIVSLPVEGGCSAFLQWVESEVGPQTTS